MIIPKVITPLDVLVAYDGSPASQACVSLLSSLPLHPKSKVTILAVGKLQEDEDPHAIARLQAVKYLQGLRFKVNSEYIQGQPAEQIIKYAIDHKNDLIVMGAIGMRATLGVLLGGVTQQVVEHAHQPVLVVRPPPVTLRRVLVATDGCHASLQAAEYLGRLPLPTGCQITVLYVMPALPEAISVETRHHHPIAPNRGALLEYEASRELTSLRASEEKKGYEILKSTQRALNHTLFGRLPVIEVSTELREGDAAGEILFRSQKLCPDLIVVGSRGLNQVRGWLLGSVSRRLIHQAPCSVLVVRGLPPSGMPGNN
jgi:nucleotide-binding universal stress UspA family protein